MELERVLQNKVRSWGWIYVYKGVPVFPMKLSIPTPTTCLSQQVQYQARNGLLTLPLSRLNIDAYGGLQYRLFQFKDPELNITSNAVVYPSLNVANRWRLNYDIKFKFEIISDMYISFSFYYNVDSRPPSATSSNTDYSFTSSFGYSF